MLLEGAYCVRNTLWLYTASFGSRKACFQRKEDIHEAFKVLAYIDTSEKVK